MSHIAVKSIKPTASDPPGVDVSVNLTCLAYKEDDLFFFYSPELDLYGYGKTEIEARESFDVFLESFLEYTIENRTLTSELIKAGWNYVSEKPMPPSMGSVIQKRRDTMDRMIMNKPVLSYEPIKIPVYAYANA